MKLPDTLSRFLPGGAWLAAALAGAANTLAFAPFGLWPLAVLSPLALYLLLRGLDARAAFTRGFAYGFGFWLAGVSWVFVSIHVYGYTPLPMAIALTLAFAAMLSLLFFAWWTAVYAWLARGILRPAVFVALWLLGEWVRSWLFTGFPWLYQGYAVIDTPLSGFAPVGGVLLVSVIMLACAVLLADIVTGTRRARLVAVAAIAALFAGGALLRGIDWTSPVKTADGMTRSLSVSLVQGNIPQDMKWLMEMQEPTIEIYAELTRNEWGRDLLIWPESAVPKLVHESLPLIDALRTRADASHSAFITGMPYAYTHNGIPVFHNTVLSIGGPSGLRMYHKVHLVPFGEVVPFADLLRAIAPFFSLQGIPLQGFTPGDDHQPPLPAGDHRLATFLCYEIVYADYVRKQARSADILLTVSNDAWFGTSHGPHQHFQIARMRALETGRWLLRGTNTGMTGIVDPSGRVTARAEPYTRTVLRGDVLPMQGDTPFMIVGEWPVLGAIALVLLMALRRTRAGLATP
ncbi:MAG: apolipoprotein N-acyltransferase [Pseudomonadota bacterium]